MGRTDKTLEAIEKGLRKDLTNCMAEAGDLLQGEKVVVRRMRVKEFAAQYGVSESTVRRWIKNGQVAHEQPAGKKGVIFLT